MENNHKCSSGENCKQPLYKSKNFIIAIILIVVATGGTINYTGVLGDRIIFTIGKKADTPTQVEPVNQIKPIYP